MEDRKIWNLKQLGDISQQEAEALSDVAFSFADHGEEFKLPWNGSVDDCEENRFVALVKACRSYHDAMREVDGAACYLDRSRVREIICGMADEHVHIAETILMAIDALPILTAADILETEKAPDSPEGPPGQV